MDDMIEHVARALARRAILDRGWEPDEDRINTGWPEWESEARSAIEAMREPTEAMLLAGERAEELGDSPAYKHWQAMIDAALNPSS